MAVMVATVRPLPREAAGWPVDRLMPVGVHLKHDRREHRRATIGLTSTSSRCPLPCGAFQFMCQLDTDVTVSAIYKCHSSGSWGRAAGGRGALGVAQRPTGDRFTRRLAHRPARGRTGALQRGVNPLPPGPDKARFGHRRADTLLTCSWDHQAADTNHPSRRKS